MRHTIFRSFGFRITALFTLLIAALFWAGGIQAMQPALGVKEARFEPGSDWPVSSAVTLTVRFEGSVAFAQWQWVGSDGKPPLWEGAAIAPRDLRPTGDVWVGAAAAPPVAGSYGVRITARVAGTTRDQILTPNTRGTAQDEVRRTRGVVYVRDRNIWIRALDGGQERALTYYGGSAVASMPSWSPDGRRIAYILDQGEIGSGLDLWTIFPGGTGARRVSQHTQGKRLAHPLYAPDGTLYVTESRPLRLGGVEIGEAWDLLRVDPASGKRVPTLVGASTPDISPDGKRVAFVQQEISSDGGILSALVVAELDGRNERVLVPPREGQGVFAPAWSPDGKQIVFAGENIGGTGAEVQFHALHGGTWDLWLVSAECGAARLLSPVQEEQPFPRWRPDGASVLYMDPDGYFSVAASGGPPVLLASHDDISELSIFAPIPRPAPPLEGQEVCFPETKQCLRGIFAGYWEKNGGLARFGFPITQELIEEGRTVQYTQRARLEWHPQNKGTPYEVLLGRLGADVADVRLAAGEIPFKRVGRPSGGNLLYFPETGHTLGPPLRVHWEGRGGLPVFGYPLSEPFRERSVTDGKEYLVQYFERNRLEYHPEFAGSPNEVLLGLLGVSERARRYGQP